MPSSPPPPAPLWSNPYSRSYWLPVIPLTVCSCQHKLLCMVKTQSALIYLNAISTLYVCIYQENGKFLGLAEQALLLLKLVGRSTQIVSQSVFTMA